MERLILVGNLVGNLFGNAVKNSWRAAWIFAVGGVLAACAASIMLTSCLTIKSEYPATSYYRLSSKPLAANAEPNAEPNAGTSPEAAPKEILMVKSFSVDSEFDTDHLLALNANSAPTSGANSSASRAGGSSATATEMQKYQYHRWISEPRELVTAYTVNRLQASQAFAGGVFTEATTVLPTLELEGRIVEFMGRNASAGGANTATVVLHLALKRVGGDAPVQRVLLQKTYTHTAPRPNDTAGSIPDALAEALSVCLDEALKDIRAAVKQ